MVWNETKLPGDVITAEDWNAQANVIIETSGSFWAHSGNKLNPHQVTLEQARIENNTLEGPIDMSDNKIINLASPIAIGDATNKEYVDRAVTSLGASYYMTDDIDSDTGYRLCSLVPPSIAETYVEVTDITDDQEIASFIAKPGESPSILLKGVYSWFIFAEKTDGTKDIRIYWKMYERSGSTEIEIDTSAESGIIESKTSYIVPLALNTDYHPWSGSRIVGKIFARAEGTGSAPSLRIYFGGNSASRWEIPANSEIFKYIFVPYSGAKKDVYLGNHSLTASEISSDQFTLNGYSISEISNDTSLADASQTAIPTEYAVKSYGDVNYYPSSQGSSLSDSLTSHVNNSSIHFTKDSINLDDLGDVSTTSLVSGNQLIYMGTTSKWKNAYPPLTFSIANVKLSGQQNLNLARFTTPPGKSCYVWQASACGSGGAAIADLKIQILSGNTVVYSTSSATVQQGSPLAVTQGNIEIRLAYSGSNATGEVYGTGFMSLSIL